MRSACVKRGGMADNKAMVTAQAVKTKAFDTHRLAGGYEAVLTTLTNKSQLKDRKEAGDGR